MLPQLLVTMLIVYYPGVVLITRSVAVLYRGLWLGHNTPFSAQKRRSQIDVEQFPVLINRHAGGARIAFPLLMHSKE